MYPTNAPAAQPLDAFIRQQFDVLQTIRENMPALLKIAGHLTPVEDLVDFRYQVEAVHAQLGALAEASTLLLSASPAGVALLQAIDAPAQRAALSLGSAALRSEGYFAQASALGDALIHLNNVSALADTLAAQMLTKANQTDQAALDTRVAALETGLAAQINTLIGNAWNTNYLGQVNTLLGQLETKVNANADGLTAQTTRLDTINGLVTNARTDITAQTTATQALTTRLAAAENTVSASSAAVTALGVRVNSAESSLAASATAVQALQVQADATETKATTAVAATTDLNTRLTTANNAITAESTAREILSSTVTTQGNNISALSDHVTQVAASLTGTGNLLSNAGFEIDVAGWTLFSVGADWTDPKMKRTPVTLGNLGAIEIGNAAVGLVPTTPTGAVSPRIPVEAQKNYFVSGYIAAQNSTAKLMYRVLDSALNMLSQGTIGSTTYGTYDLLPAWPRSFLKVPIPVNGVWLELRLWSDLVSAALPKAFLLRPMVEEALAEQTQPSPWVDAIGGILTANASATSALSARVDATEAGLQAQAASTTNLEGRVGTAEASLVNEMIVRNNKTNALTQSVNSLSSQITALESGATTQANATSDLNTRVTSAEGRLDSHSTSITNLSASVALLPAVYLQATAPPGTNYNIGDMWFDSANSNKQYIWDGATWNPTAAPSGINTYAQIAAPTGGAYKSGDLWIDTDDNNRLYRWNGGAWVDLADPRTAANASAITNLTTRVTAAENTLTSQASSITNINSSLAGKASSAALAALDTRVVSAENSITSQASSINSINTDLGTKASSSALSALDSRVTSAEGTISSHTSSINSINAALPGKAAASALSALDTRVTSAEGTISAHTTSINSINAELPGKAAASALSSLETRVTSAEGTVSSHTTSINSLNSSVAGKADASITDSRITAVDGKANTALAQVSVTTNVNGYLTGWKIQNTGAFGDFSIMADKFSVVDPTDSSRWMSFVGGNLNVSGLINGSLIQSSAMSIGASRITTGGGRLAPFSIRDVGCSSGGNGSQASRSITIGNFVSPNYGTGYNWKRFAEQVMDVYIDVMVGTDTAAATGGEDVTLQYSVDGGAWVTIMTMSGRASYGGCIPLVCRFTTPSSWNTLDFRAYTSQNNTASLTMSVQVMNCNSSGNAPGSNSGMAGAAPTAPPAPSSGTTYCVSTEAWVIKRSGPARASSVVVGDELMLSSGRWGQVSHSKQEMSPGVRLTLANGTQLTCSDAAPLEGLAAHPVLAPYSLGSILRTNTGDSEVIQREILDMIPVQHITCEDDFFWAGDTAEQMLSHHNRKLD